MRRFDQARRQSHPSDIAEDSQAIWRPLTEAAVRIHWAAIAPTVIDANGGDAWLALALSSTPRSFRTELALALPKLRSAPSNRKCRDTTEHRQSRDSRLAARPTGVRTKRQRIVSHGAAIFILCLVILENRQKASYVSLIRFFSPDS